MLGDVRVGYVRLGYGMLGELRLCYVAYLSDFRPSMFGFLDNSEKPALYYNNYCTGAQRNTP